MKTIKHLFTALLLLCTTTVAAHDFEVDGIYYNITDAINKTVEVTYRGSDYNSYNEYTGSVVIPESVTYIGTTYSVTSIGRYAFRDCTGLTSIEIPNSVTSIREWAFYDCSGLTGIEIPNSVTSIGYEAFDGCTGLTSVHISDLAAWCGIDFGSEDANPLYYAKNLYLNGEKLTELTIPDGIVEIKNYAFRNCTGLTSITIPNSVTSIGRYAFAYCTGLTSIVIGNSVTSIGSNAFNGCDRLTSVHISDLAAWCGIDFGSADANPLYYAKNLYLNGEKLTELTIPDGIVEIKNYAFRNCTGLTSITIPNSVTSIGRNAFAYCTGLTSIEIPNSVTSIGSNAFAYCDELTSIEIPNSVTSIGSTAFEGCTGLTSIEIPNSVTSIGSSAFYGCTGLKSVINFSNLTFSKGLSSNGYVAYYADNVYNAPNGSIEGDFIFGKPNDVNTLLGYLGNDAELTLPANYKGENYAIGASVFENNTTIRSIEIGNSVTSIGSGAFDGCSGLTNIIIPNSVTSIGDYAFYGCTGLKSVINFSNLTFSKGLSSNGYVAYYADNVYNAPNGSIEGDFIFGKPNDVNTLLGYLGNDAELTLPANYKGENYAIGASVFENNTTIRSIEIGNSVTSIGSGAFDGCSGLTSIIVATGNANYDSRDNCNAIIETATNTLVAGCKNTSIPNNVTSIERYAFYGCSGLTGIEIPNSVTSIGYEAFDGCTGLTSVHISDLAAWCGIDFGSEDANPLYYAKNLYLNGEKLTELTIPDGIVEIKNYAFRNCTGLTSITIPNSVTSIGRNAFAYCTGLTSIEISNSVTSIGDSAFHGCSRLTSVTIPNSVTSIGNSVFRGCTGLTSVEFNAENCTNIGSYDYPVFSNCTALSTITIGENVKNIPAYAFRNCSGLASVTIGNSVTSIGASAFHGCSGLSSVEIPNNVTSIGTYAFYNCSGLTSVVIGDSVTSIGVFAFYGCTNLKTVYNFSNLSFSKGSSSNGCVAYYADKVYNAPNGSIEDGFIFGKPNGVNTLLYYLGNATKLTLPANYKGENYAIGADVFYVNTTITSVVIPNSVTSIGSNAFEGCSGLASIEIPSSVTSIGSSAFYGCTGLKSVINFSNLTFSKGSNNNGYVAYYADKVYNAPNGSIEGDFIFGKPNDVNTLVGYLGNATELTLPGDYKGENYAIGASVFKGNTTITSVEIPNSVTSIGSSAFYGCTGLKSVINFSNLTFSKGSSNNGYVAYYADKVYNAPNGSIEGDFIFGKPNDVNTLLYYSGNATELALPGDYKGENYVIGASVFENNTTITSVEIPNSVTSIVGAAFNGCTGLTSIIVATGNANYDSRDNCNAIIETATNTLVAGCKNTSIPNNVTSIGDYAFCDCTGLASIVIPNSVTSIGISAFENCTGLTSVTIPNSVTSIGGSAFSGCSGLSSVEIPNNVTSIGTYAFYNCSGLTSVVIGDSVTSIGVSAFYGCTNLKTVYNFSNLSFSKGSSSNGYVAYYADKVYNAPNGSIEDGFIFGKPNGVNTLLYYLGNATELTLPGDYKGENYAIGASVFENNTTITSIEIPNGVTSIGYDAFRGCSGLTSIEIPGNITSIGGSAFERCTGLEKVCINDLEAWCGIDFGSADANPLYYAKNLYLNGELLTELSIPAEVAEVKDYAFYNCNGVTNIDIVDGVKSVGNSSFYGCSDLETLYISNTIENIDDYAFAECNNILDIKIGSKKAIAASENIFSSDAYTNVCLYVPTGRKFAYEKATPWKNFYIAEMDFTGIEDVYDEVKGENGEGKTIYDLQGRKVEVPSEGLYIIDGKKVVIK